MESLDWKDISETDISSKQNAFHANPWLGATMFLIAAIAGFVIGNFIK